MRRAQFIRSAILTALFVLCLALPASAASATPRSGAGGKTESAPAVQSAPSQAAQSQVAASTAAVAAPAAPAAPAQAAAITPAAPAAAAPVPTAAAQAPTFAAVKITVSHDGTDSIGAKLALQIRETFNTSSLFALTESDVAKFSLLLSTEAEFQSRPSVGSAYAAVWIFNQGGNTFPLYLARETGTIAPDGIADLATRLAARTQDVAAKYAYLTK